MDNNGRLELISSECHGTGHFTSTQIWEVNDAFDALIPCQQDENCGPVIMPKQVKSNELDTIPTFYDLEQNIYYYVFDDIVRDGARKYYGSTRATFLQVGEVKGFFLAFSETLYTDDGETTTYQDAEGNSLTRGEYVTTPDAYFRGYEKHETKVKWIENEHLLDFGKDEIYEMIKGSYEAFVID